MRGDIISKEPEFIRTIVKKIHWVIRDLRNDVKISDEEIQEKKRRRKKVRAEKIAVKKEIKRKKEEERKAKLDIIHDRAEIINL